MTTLEQPKKTRRPRKPDAKKINERIGDFTQKIYATHIIPYLQWCLNTAQAKTKYKLHFCDAMGTTCLYTEAGWSQGSGWTTVEHAGEEAAGFLLDRMYPARRQKLDRLKEHFPELVSLFKTVFELQANALPDDIYPEVPPREDDGTRDISDYVEEGPLVGCQTEGCMYVSIEDDFILGPSDSRICEDCANGRGPYRG